jgi:hypothetical protein
VQFELSWLYSSGCGKLSSMGNKDARKREKKKPKQKKPKREDFNQAAARIVREAPKS